MIREWLAGQLDYACFLSGLALILLAIQCLGRGGKAAQHLSWGWLALFGLLRGLSDWMSAFSQSQEFSLAFEGCRVALTGAACVALVEFGRRGFFRGSRRKWSGFLTPALCAAAAGGALFGGFAELEAASLYALALPGGLLAALVFLRSAQTTKGIERHGLQAAFISLLALVVTMSLAVPPAAFFPADSLNCVSFSAVTGIPIQIPAMLSALGVMAAVCYSSPEKKRATPRHFLEVRWLCPAAFSCLIVLGWFVADWRGRCEDEQKREGLRQTAAEVTRAVSPELARELTFTAADQGTPAFDHIRQQLISYRQLLAIRGIYSYASRDGEIVFGPENYAEDDPQASPPGTVYEQPSSLAHQVISLGLAGVEGPYTDEYGTFVSAAAPVIDPHSGKVVMAISLDIEAANWAATLNGSRLEVIVLTLAAILVFWGGLLGLRWRVRLAAARRANSSIQKDDPRIGSTSRHGCNDRRSTGLAVGMGALAVGFLIVVLLQTWYWTRRHVDEDADGRARLMVNFDNALRTYFSQNIRPELEKRVGPGEFIPEAMSSSFVARSVFEQVGETFPDALLRFPSTNPRNPINRAAPAEEEIIRYFEEHPEAESWAGMMQFFEHGEQFFVRAVPRRFKAECLHCHGRPEDAPASMRERYGDRAGFGRSVGEVSLDLAAIPVGAVYDVAREQIWRHLLVAIGLCAAFLTGLGVLIRADFRQRRRAENSLRESEERFRTVSTFTGQLVYDWDVLSGRIIWAGRTLSLVGRTLEEMNDQGLAGWEALVHPDDRNRTMALLNAAMRDRKPFFCEYRYQKADGTYLDIREEGAFLYDEADHAVRMVGVMKDVTAQKRVEAERRRRVEEIERFNRIALRREHRIIELKEQINELARLAGQAAPYAHTRFNEEPPPEQAGEADAVVTAEVLPEFGLAPTDETADYELPELLDLAQMQRLLDSFCGAVGIAAALIDLQGKVLVGSRWQRICTDFHRVNAQTLQKCIESDTSLANRLQAGESCTVYQCCNGLTDAASPVTINGRHLANVFVGQFLIEEPDEERFRRQAVEYGFDEQEYFNALRQVPIVPREKLPAILNFLVCFAELTAIMGLERLHGKQTEARLARHAAEMSARNLELDRQRAAALNLAEDAEQTKMAAERSEAALRESEERFRTVVSAARDAIVVMGPEEKITLWSPGAEAVFGWKAEEALGRNVHELLAPLQYSEAYRRGFATFQTTGEGPAMGKTLELTALHKDGHEFPVELSLSPLALNGRWGAVCLLRNISRRKEAEAALRRERDRAQQYLDIAGVLLVALDEKGYITLLNRRGHEILGYEEGTLIGLNWFETCLPPEVRDHTRVLFEQIIEGQIGGSSCRETPILTSAGTRRMIAWHNVSLADESGRIIGTLSSGEDITDRRNMEEELRAAASTDKLTGLPNRALFLDRLQQAVLRAKRLPDYRFAVLFLDFDRFKIINDSLGHKSGDMLLQEAGVRLRSVVRTNDSLSRFATGNTTARLGGDEFVVLLDGIQQVADAQLVADRLLSALARPYHLGEHEVYSTASIGIVTSEIAADSAEDILRDADTAMYEAKLAGKGRYMVFDVSMRQRVQQRLVLENDLRRAVEHGQFFLEYQPIVSLETMEVESFEALIRWEHPECGPISPGEFVPLAEDTGLIVPIGEWVLREACRQFADWRRTAQGAVPRSISVNLSRNQLLLSDLPDKIRQILKENDLPPSALHLELTESAVMRDVESAKQVLRALKEIGLKLNMDDFGTGHSSLACLHQFPFDVLKIDRSFIVSVDRGRDLAALVHAVITLARNLNISVVAEGIETRDQLIMLQSLGCQFGQGFYFSKPLPADKATAFRAATVAMEGERAGQGRSAEKLVQPITV